MSYPDTTINLWSTPYPQHRPSVQQRHQQAYISSNTIYDILSQIPALLLFTLLLFCILYPQKVMDLVDAYMELPSFADIPLIIRDQFRGFVRRGVKMQAPLVFRPFASDNNILTWRDTRGVLPSRDESWGDRSEVDGVEPARGMSLSDRLKGRGWTSSPPSKIPGLVNTGNFCFMNSVLQALASLAEFQHYLEAIDEGADTTPVTSSLADLLKHLNTPHKFSTALHPDQVARALMQSDKHRLLATREQQDAQEFFSFLMDTLESESVKQYLIVNKPPGLETFFEDDISVKTMSSNESLPPNPFEGLSAHRMGCLKCKYVENIRHEKFGPMVLPLTMSRNTTLEECLHGNFEMEILDDVECQKCTLLAYRQSLTKLTKYLEGKSSGEEVKQRLRAINEALESGKIEDPKLLGGGEIKKFIQRSPKTKAYMIARPPRIAVFHIQRSSFHNFTGRAMKIQASVRFPVELDVSEYVTNSTLSMDPEEPISKWKEGDPRTIYRLKSVIVHYGLHHIGHYVAYRCVGDEWFRISDEDVEHTTVEEVLKEGARGVFMLMYELVESAGTEWRGTSVAPTINTVETIPDGISVSEDALEEDSDWEDESPVTEGASLDFRSRPLLHFDNDRTTESELHLGSDPPDDLLQPENAPTNGPARLKNDRRSNGPSLLEMVESKLEATHISPTSSIASHSTGDSIVELGQKSTRSTSFSSIHSRPQTPIFEVQDPQLSRPPLKRVRREIIADDQEENNGISEDGIGSLE